MSTDDQRTNSHRRNIAENFNRLSRVHERYRQTTDGHDIDIAKERASNIALSYGDGVDK